METISVLQAVCEENPPVTGGFPSQRPVTRISDVFIDLRLNKRLSIMTALYCTMFGIDSPSGLAENKTKQNTRPTCCIY